MESFSQMQRLFIKLLRNEEYQQKQNIFTESFFTVRKNSVVWIVNSSGKVQFHQTIMPICTHVTAGMFFSCLQEETKGQTGFPCYFSVLSNHLLFIILINYLPIYFVQLLLLLSGQIINSCQQKYKSRNLKRSKTLTQNLALKWENSNIFLGCHVLA